MDQFTRGWLESEGGFRGFVTFEGLSDTKPPSHAGIYVVIRVGDKEPSFLERSRGGHFKGKDPTVAIEVLRENWVQGAAIVYIGKAEDLRTRLNQFRRYGIGRPVGHQGGRYIWQCEDCYEYLVAWRETEEAARDVERNLIAEFVQVYGRRPFANLID